MWRKGTLISVVCSLALIGCSLEDKDSPTAATGTRGAISMRLAIDPASPFKSLAKTGTLTVSAADMPAMSAPLTIGDSTVAAEISGIPVGKSRSIELKVFGLDGTLAYKGAGSADIFPDSTTKVAINLVRSTGSAVIVGKIIEDTAATAWPAPVNLSLGAQASPTLGGVLDIDLAEVWLSAKANANQGGIDLVFMFYGGTFHLDNAVAAKEAGVTHSINLTNTYDPTKIKEVRLVKVTARPSDQETAKRVFSSGAKIRGSVISGGEIFLVESTEGRLAALTVAAVVGTGNSGTADVRLERTTIP